MMTLIEQQAAVCGKMPELFIKMHDKWRWIEHPEKAGWNYAINWPTEGLQVCYEAAKLIVADGGGVIISNAKNGDWIVLIRCNKRGYKVRSKNLLEAFLEGICKVWWPEKWKD